MDFLLSLSRKNYLHTGGPRSKEHLVEQFMSAVQPLSLPRSPPQLDAGAAGQGKKLHAALRFLADCEKGGGRSDLQQRKVYSMMNTLRMAHIGRHFFSLGRRYSLLFNKCFLRTVEAIAAFVLTFFFVVASFNSSKKVCGAGPFFFFLNPKPNFHIDAAPYPDPSV